MRTQGALQKKTREGGRSRAKDVGKLERGKVVPWGEKKTKKKTQKITD